MTGTYIIKRGASGLVLLGALVALLVGYAGIQATTASGAAADQTGADFRSAGPTADTPTLTNDVGQPADDSGSQLPLGLGLLGLGLLGIVCGLTAMMRRRPPHRRNADARATTWSGAARPPADIPERSRPT